jgi:cytochrome c peroxidase
MNIYTIIAFIAALSVGGSQAFQAVYRKTPVAVLALGAQPGCPEAGLEAGRVDGRRAFLWTTVLSSSALVANTFLPLPASAAATVNYKAVAKDITDMVKQDPDKGPTFVRLAWHSSGTYDKITRTGGSGEGTIRFKEELAHGGNAGLADTAVVWLEPLYKKYKKDGLSYADLYTLSGVASIKQMNGPIIPWGSGRVDAMSPIVVTPDGRLPNADVGPKGADKSDAAHLRDVFYRMGFNDQEIVCLSGAHALGRCHTTASGYDGPWTPTPTTFNNAYYTLLSNLNWVPKEWDGPYQYVDAPTGRLMMLPTDLVLLQDKSFAKYVKEYASNPKKFDYDFTVAFQKLEELGTNNLTPCDWA